MMGGARGGESGCKALAVKGCVRHRASGLMPADGRQERSFTPPEWLSLFQTRGFPDDSPPS